MIHLTWRLPYLDQQERLVMQQVSTPLPKSSSSPTPSEAAAAA
jgi:hypothetical protein